ARHPRRLRQPDADRLDQGRHRQHPDGTGRLDGAGHRGRPDDPDRLAEERRSRRRRRRLGCALAATLLAGRSTNAATPTLFLPSPETRIMSKPKVIVTIAPTGGMA